MEIQCFETIIVFKDKLTEVEYLNKVKEYKKWLSGLPAIKISTERIGQKALFHETRGCKYGWYVEFIYESTEDLVNSKLDLILRKDDDVIKFITVRHTGDYIPDEYDPSEELKSEQKKIVDVFDLIFDLNE